MVGVRWKAAASHFLLKLIMMNNSEKLSAMEKLLRELEDLTNSQTSVIKKLGQVEADNINLGDKYLEENLMEIYEHADEALTKATEVQQEYANITAKFREAHPPTPVNPSDN